MLQMEREIESGPSQGDRSVVDQVTIQKVIVPTSSTARVNPADKKETNRGQKQFESEMREKKRRDKSATHVRKDSDAAELDADRTMEEVPVDTDGENPEGNAKDKGAGSGHGKHIDILA